MWWIKFSYLNLSVSQSDRLYVNKIVGDILWKIERKTIRCAYILNCILPRVVDRFFLNFHFVLLGCSKWFLAVVVTERLRYCPDPNYCFCFLSNFTLASVKFLSSALDPNIWMSQFLFLKYVESSMGLLWYFGYLDFWNICLIYLFIDNKLSESEILLCEMWKVHLSVKGLWNVHNV